ncbi:MAG: hypothetical protein BGO01_11265 [Armatimonadetes bacterium 55-13]|nr:MAG: hypothetical protein BGO01_11265 [Armatimonadetes bacterium 55-13]
MVQNALICSLLFGLAGAAVQKQTFDIASYDAPAEWTAKKGGDYISYSKTDGENWCQIAIYHHRISKGSIKADFDNEWKELVAEGKTISEPEKTEPQMANGWSVMAGTGLWKYNGANVASVLTVYSNKKVCVSVLCNTTAQPYVKDYQTLLASLSLDASKASNAPVSAAPANKSSLVGLWVDYKTENNGYQNGSPMLTGGYFRREYLLKSDGTYVFRAKDWSVLAGDILFIYETGSWKVNGNKITITPKKGKGGWWGKTRSTKEWGPLKRASSYKLQPTSYTFELHYESLVKETFLVLYNGQGTQRDRGTSGGGQNRWSYSPRELTKSLIDNPPGFKIP